MRVGRTNEKEMVRGRQKLFPRDGRVSLVLPWPVLELRGSIKSAQGMASYSSKGRRRSIRDCDRSPAPPRQFVEGCGVDSQGFVCPWDVDAKVLFVLWDRQRKEID